MLNILHKEQSQSNEWISGYKMAPEYWTKKIGPTSFLVTVTLVTELFHCIDNFYDYFFWVPQG